MPERTEVDTRHARALAHPVRVAIVAGLANGPRTVASLAREIDATESSVARHVRALETMGLLEAHTDEDGRRTYELVREPIVFDEPWDQISLPARRSAAAAALAQVHAQATAALDGGGFDRGDIHLSRTSIRVTEELWEETAALLRETLRRLGELSEKADADGSADPRIQATAVMMLFTGEHSGSAGADEPVPEFGEYEARERTYRLVEALQTEATTPRADWERLAALAGELRLVARAAMSVEDGAQQVAPRQPAADR